jgi:hypothetical protein
VTTIEDYAAARNLRDELARRIAHLVTKGITPSTIHTDLYTEYEASVEKLRSELRGWAA